jgi:hypothetical protein
MCRYPSTNKKFSYPLFLLHRWLEHPLEGWKHTVKVFKLPKMAEISSFNCREGCHLCLCEFERWTSPKKVDRVGIVQYKMTSSSNYTYIALIIQASVRHPKLWIRLLPLSEPKSQLIEKYGLERGDNQMHSLGPSTKNFATIDLPGDVRISKKMCTKILNFGTPYQPVKVYYGRAVEPINFSHGLIK